MWFLRVRCRFLMLTLWPGSSHHCTYHHLHNATPPLHTGSLQLMFQMDGEHSSAMVSLAVRRATLWGRKLQFTSLAVDLPSGERLLLKGPSSSVVFQGYTKLRWQLNLHSCLEYECECYIMYVAIIILTLYMWQIWGGTSWQLVVSRGQCTACRLHRV